MNKNAKASIAVGAGILLLLGGGGTLAVWNASDDISGGTVNAGTLDLDTTGVEGAWYLGVDADEDGVADTDATTGLYETTGSAIDTDEYPVVPGDILVFKVDGISLSYLGANLYYYFGLTGLEGTDANGYTVSDVATYSTEDYGTVATGTFAPAAPAGTSVYHVADTATGAAAATTAEISATVAVAFGSATDDETTAEAVPFSQLSLSDAAIAVQQVIRTGA
ncbi:MAG: alternate-type signal peptide domain-containing protein [Microbacteriaceae bacterium]|nr:alternate-type signal peptide domain-containing protein [Microbacteriaceae bacterium]